MRWRRRACLLSFMVVVSGFSPPASRHRLRSSASTSSTIDPEVLRIFEASELPFTDAECSLVAGNVTDLLLAQSNQQPHQAASRQALAGVASRVAAAEFLLRTMAEAAAAAAAAAALMRLYQAAPRALRSRWHLAACLISSLKYRRRTSRRHRSTRSSSRPSASGAPPRHLSWSRPSLARALGRDLGGARVLKAWA